MMAPTEVMKDSVRGTVLAAIERAPAWIRRDLASNNAATRRQADEALAAMIVSALEATGEG